MRPLRAIGPMPRPQAPVTLRPGGRMARIDTHRAKPACPFCTSTGRGAA